MHDILVPPFLTGEVMFSASRGFLEKVLPIVILWGSLGSVLSSPAM